MKWLVFWKSRLLFLSHTLWANDQQVSLRVARPGILSEQGRGFGKVTDDKADRVRFVAKQKSSSSLRWL